MATHLTKNFTLEELILSDYAVRHDIHNMPGLEAHSNLLNLCKFILQPLRDYLQTPIVITSGYRGFALNKAIGGSTSSQHMVGQAADFNVPGMTVPKVIETIKYLDLPYDQVIDEFSNSPSGGWVHVSYGPKDRRQHLLARKRAGGTVYTKV
jgi:uncharacterized protein YcbK (DUF882 family)